MALVRCIRHLEPRRLRAKGYTRWIAPSHLPDVIICGRKGCTEKGAIVLKDGEKGIVSFYTSALKLDISPYQRFASPL